MNHAAMNASRFDGFADLYEDFRPSMPYFPIKIIKQYLERTPDLVVDLGCGTGLSALSWKNHCKQIIGIDPNKEMLSIAQKKQQQTLSFKEAFSDDTQLPDQCADVVICSQSFHWMNPQTTLLEVSRILKSGGIFATVDCDWPPICNWLAEKAYNTLFARVAEIEKTNPEVNGKFTKWNKEQHLTNMIKSQHFRFAREIVFSNEESCDVNRFIHLALTQGGLHHIVKKRPDLISASIEDFKNTVSSIFPTQQTFSIHFSYRMRIAIK
ncbi:MAG TPA: class I SAM-dependent methyltransferase [Ruminococcaceae bacterium]|nr:class I SAM-dependent methyltransferase [Oscillospiraceae bacterium]